jgi:hypothetical protein
MGKAISAWRFKVISSGASSMMLRSTSSTAASCSLRAAEETEGGRVLDMLFVIRTMD